jgi:hypothetical protein
MKLILEGWKRFLRESNIIDFEKELRRKRIEDLEQAERDRVEQIALEKKKSKKQQVIEKTSKVVQGIEQRLKDRLKEMYKKLSYEYKDDFIPTYKLKKLNEIMEKIYKSVDFEPEEREPEEREPEEFDELKLKRKQKEIERYNSKLWLWLMPAISISDATKEELYELASSQDMVEGIGNDIYYLLGGEKEND